MYTSSNLRPKILGSSPTPSAARNQKKLCVLLGQPSILNSPNKRVRARVGVCVCTRFSLIKENPKGHQSFWGSSYVRHTNISNAQRPRLFFFPPDPTQGLRCEVWPSFLVVYGLFGWDMGGRLEISSQNVPCPSGEALVILTVAHAGYVQMPEVLQRGIWLVCQGDRGVPSF